MGQRRVLAAGAKREDSRSPPSSGEGQSARRHVAHFPQNPFQPAVVLDPFAINGQFLLGKLQPDGFPALLACPIVIGAVAVFGIFMATATRVTTSNLPRLDAALAEESDSLQFRLQRIEAFRVVEESFVVGHAL